MVKRSARAATRAQWTLKDVSVVIMQVVTGEEEVVVESVESLCEGDARKLRR